MEYPIMQILVACFNSSKALAQTALITSLYSLLSQDGGIMRSWYALALQAGQERARKPHGLSVSFLGRITICFLHFEQIPQLAQPWSFRRSILFLAGSSSGVNVDCDLRW